MGWGAAADCCFRHGLVQTGRVDLALPAVAAPGAGAASPAPPAATAAAVAAYVAGRRREMQPDSSPPWRFGRTSGWHRLAARGEKDDVGAPVQAAGTVLQDDARGQSTEASSVLASGRVHGRRRSTTSSTCSRPIVGGRGPLRRQRGGMVGVFFEMIVRLVVGHQPGQPLQEGVAFHVCTDWSRVCLSVVACECGVGHVEKEDERRTRRLSLNSTPRTLIWTLALLCHTGHHLTNHDLSSTTREWCRCRAWCKVKPRRRAGEFGIVWSDMSNL